MIRSQMKQTAISIAKAIMDPDFRSLNHFSKPTVVFWGPHGCGKTSTITEAATSLHIPAINVRLSQEPAEDMSYPEVALVNNQKKLKKIIAEMFPVYAKDEFETKIPRRTIDEKGRIIELEGQYQIDFKSIKTYIDNYEIVAAYYENLGLSINDAPGAILFLDEINRIEDKMMFQMIFQLFDSGKFKSYVLPEEISIFGACNPNKGYIVSNWFADGAFANRCIHLKAFYDFNSWLEIAKSKGYSETTIQFYKTFPDALFNKENNSFDVPKVDPSYRNAAFLDLYVDKVDYGDPSIKELMLHAIVGLEYTNGYYKVEQKILDTPPTAEEILTNYDVYDVGAEPLIRIPVGESLTNEPYSITEIGTLVDAIKEQPNPSPLRARVLNAVENDKTDFLTQVSDNIASYLKENIEDEDFRKMLRKNRLRFLRFMMDLNPGDYGTLFQQLIGNTSKTAELISNTLSEDDDPNSEEGQYFVQTIKHRCAMQQVV